jgi:hypothetical protein
VDLCFETYVSLDVTRSSDGANGSLADLKIWGPDGAGDPAPAAADPVKYTRMSLAV